MKQNPNDLDPSTLLSISAILIGLSKIKEGFYKLYNNFLTGKILFIPYGHHITNVEIPKV